MIIAASHRSPAALAQAAQAAVTAGTGRDREYSPCGHVASQRLRDAVIRSQGEPVA